MHPRRLHKPTLLIKLLSNTLKNYEKYTIKQSVINKFTIVSCFLKNYTLYVYRNFMSVLNLQRHQPASKKTSLASHMSVNTVPFQRTDISMQPLEPTF